MGASSEEIDSSALMSNIGSGLDINDNMFEYPPKSQNSITSPHIEDQAAISFNDKSNKEYSNQQAEKSPASSMSGLQINQN